MAPANSGGNPEKAGLTRVSAISVIDRPMAGSKVLQALFPA